MKNHKSIFAAVPVVAALTLIMALPPQADAAPALGDSPGAFALVSGMTFTNGMSAVSTTFTNNGQYLGNAYLLLNVTNSAGTTPGLVCTLQSSTDNSTWTTLSPTVTVTTNVPASGQGVVVMALVGPIQNYAYLRTTNVLSGTTPSFSGSLSLLMPAKYR